MKQPTASSINTGSLAILAYPTRSFYSLFSKCLDSLNILDRRSTIGAYEHRIRRAKGGRGQGRGRGGEGGGGLAMRNDGLSSILNKALEIDIQSGLRRLLSLLIITFLLAVPSVFTFTDEWARFSGISPLLALFYLRTAASIKVVNANSEGNIPASVHLSLPSSLTRQKGKQ